MPPQSVVVFKVNQIGDAICFLPVLQKLLASKGVGSIHLWTTPAAAPILACDPSIQVHTLPLPAFNGAWKNPLRFFQIVKTTTHARPDACLLDWDQGNVAHLAAAMSGATHVIGGTNPNVRLNGRLRYRSVPQPDTRTPQWCWDIGRLFADVVLKEPWEATPPMPDLSHLTGPTHSICRTPHSPVLIHPGASREYQRWPIGRYLELASLLVKSHPVTMVQPRELPPIEVPLGVSMIAPTTLAQLATAIASSSLFIGNNSGPMNFAIALGIPSVVPWGPTAPNWAAQWHPERHLSLIRKELPCIGCDTRNKDSQCHNDQELHACMRRWQTHEMLTECLRWHDQWSTIPQ
ncbi:glycosyltransferase family 9 protein [Phragmitibacter flavus]|uniref:Glycosyltransferase family 9 protein n=1 Tax=Phragmitibacter flavus TaxID=2576071 RepID=A0A5R8KF23_9BACT|nr:glycosyltransferase family 9 protein [Phragmitibacter flavus]TLD70892.1 glycosyltransferase family 9 protein [Phragmitibacter flavus]